MGLNKVNYDDIDIGGNYASGRFDANSFTNLKASVRNLGFTPKTVSIFIRAASSSYAGYAAMYFADTPSNKNRLIMSTAYNVQATDNDVSSAEQGIDIVDNGFDFTLANDVWKNYAFWIAVG